VIEYDSNRLVDLSIAMTLASSSGLPILSFTIPLKLTWEIKVVAVNKKNKKKYFVFIG
jgi:hypothetical protein